MGFMDKSFSSGKSFSFGKLNDRIVGTIISIDESGTTMPNDKGETFAATILEIEVNAEKSISHDQEKELVTLTTGDVRTLWLPENRRQLCRAVQDAVKAAGAREITEGSTIVVVYAAVGEQKNPGFSKPKLFEASYKPAPARTTTMSVDDLI